MQYLLSSKKVLQNINVGFIVKVPASFPRIVQLFPKVGMRTCFEELKIQ